MGGFKYLLLGLVFILVAGSLLYFVPEFVPATISVIMGGIVLGLAMFGLIFLLVGFDDLNQKSDSNI